MQIEKMTTNKTHTTAVVLIPPEEVWEPIQALRRAHDRNFDRWMPHITLLYPFAEREAFSQVTPILATVAAQIKPFQCHLSHFDHFHHRRSCTIFLRPLTEEPVINLHTSLLKAVPDYNDTATYPGGFHPHLSIGQFRHQQAQRDQQKLQSDWTPLEFEVKEVCIISRTPETADRFVVEEILVLGSLFD